MTDFEKRTQEVLEESATRLDGHTRSRLTQARHAALARLDKPARGWRSYVPAGAAAAAAVLAVMFYAGPRNGAGPAPLAGDETEIFADVDAPDFTEDSDDVEFYEWAGGEVES